MGGGRRFPKQLYSFLPAIYPHLIDAMRQCGVTSNELFVLSYVKNVGKELAPAVHALPIADLKDMLKKIGYSDSGATGFVTTHLANKKRYLAHHRLTPEEKETLFPDSAGYRDVVYVTELGMAKLSEMRDRIETLYKNAVKGIRGIPMKALIGAFSAVADSVTVKLQKLNRDS